MALVRRTDAQIMRDMMERTQSEISKWREELVERLEVLQQTYDTVHQMCQVGIQLVEEAQVLVAVLDPLDGSSNSLSEYTKGAWGSLEDMEEYIKYLEARTENFHAK